MVKLNYSIEIRAPREKIWNVMLADATYREWTAEFGAGSHYKGEWKEGSRMLFLAPGENGEMGMISRIKSVQRPDFLSIEHLGVVTDGQEDTSSESVAMWAGAHENYTFRETDGLTTLVIDLDSDEQMKEMFDGLWPKALLKLKQIAER